MQFCLFCGHQNNFLSQLGRNDERLTLTYFKECLPKYHHSDGFAQPCVLFTNVQKEIFLTVVSKNKVIMKTLNTLLALL